MTSITMAVLLCVLVVYCWKRNRRLEYKYMKLVRHKVAAAPSAASSHKETPVDDGGAGCDTELAAAESCALDDGEEDDGEEVSVTVPIKGYGLINKIRSMAMTKVCTSHLVRLHIEFVPRRSLYFISIFFAE